MTLNPLPFSALADPKPLPQQARPFLQPLLALATPFRVLSNLLTGQPTLDQMAAETQHLVTLQRRKFTKQEAGYFPLAPVPPLGWRYECGRCRFYESASKTCSVMGLPSDDFGGETVHPLAWCAYWLPLEDQPLLAWVTEFGDPSLIPPGVNT
jgi:hypothetical protein